MDSRSVSIVVLVLLGASPCCVGQSTLDIQIVTDNSLVNVLVNPGLKALVNLLSTTISLLPDGDQLATQLQAILQAVEDAVLDTTVPLKQRLQRLVLAVQSAIPQIQSILKQGNLDIQIKTNLENLLVILQALLTNLNAVLLLPIFGLLGK